MVRLSDVATIRRGYLEPPDSLLYFDGEPAIGLGLSTVTGGNVVRTGEAVHDRLEELESMRPLGMELHVISYQSDTVTKAVNGFLINLAEALAIVIGLLVLFMGLRSGLLIGSILLLDILGTFIFMNVYDISLQRISLGALIIALGMLVDNAIVVTEGILVRMQRGIERIRAARESVQETMWPLLGATIVAILNRLTFRSGWRAPDAAEPVMSTPQWCCVKLADVTQTRQIDPDALRTEKEYTGCQ